MSILYVLYKLNCAVFIVASCSLRKNGVYKPYFMVLSNEKSIVKHVFIKWVIRCFSASVMLNRKSLFMIAKLLNVNYTSRL